MKRLLSLLLIAPLLALPACDSGGEDGGSYTVELGARPQAAFSSSASATLSSASTASTDSLDPVIDASGEGVTVVRAGQQISVTAGDTVRLKACIEGECDGFSLRHNFDEWGGDLAGRTENPTTVRVENDMTIYAVFRVAKSYDIQHEFLSGDTLASGEEQTLNVNATVETYRGETKPVDYIGIVQDAPAHEDAYIENSQTLTHSWTPQEPGKKCVEIGVSWGVQGLVKDDSLYVEPLTEQNTDKTCEGVTY